MTKVPRTLFGTGIGVTTGSIIGSIIAKLLYGDPAYALWFGAVMGAWLCISVTWLLETYWPDNQSLST